VLVVVLIPGGVVQDDDVAILAAPQGPVPQPDRPVLDLERALRRVGEADLRPAIALQDFLGFPLSALLRLVEHQIELNTPAFRALAVVNGNFEYHGPLSPHTVALRPCRPREVHPSFEGTAGLVTGGARKSGKKGPLYFFSRFSRRKAKASRLAFSTSALSPPANPCSAFGTDTSL